MDTTFTISSGATVNIKDDGSFTYDPNGQFEYLGDGETAIDTFTYTVTDEHGATNDGTVTVTVEGINDAPVIRVEGGDVDEMDFDETNSSLSASGTLTVFDPEVMDEVTVEVLPNNSPTDTNFVITETHPGYPTSGRVVSDQAIFDMFSLSTPNPVLDNSEDTDQFRWDFDSVVENFDYLSPGESIEITFTLKAEDSNSASTTYQVTVKIDGTNDAPVVADVDVTASKVPAPVSDPEGNTITDTTEKDANSEPRVSMVRHLGTGETGDPRTTGSWMVNGMYGAITMYEDGSFVYNVDRLHPDVAVLFEGETLNESFEFQVTDEHGAPSTIETVNVTIEGADGILLDGILFTGNTGEVTEYFRFAESSGFGSLLSSDEGGERGPILTLIPTYSGTASPGQIIKVSILGAGGELLPGGQMTVNADVAGNWIANFSNLILGDFPYTVQVEIFDSNWSGALQRVGLQTFYAPAITPTFGQNEGLSVDSILGRRLSGFAIDFLNDANRYPGGGPVNPNQPNYLPGDIRNLIPPGVDENGGSGQGTGGDGEEEDPDNTSQGNPDETSPDGGQPGEPDEDL